MSFLAPLYALGALAVGLPILFHLIRRKPKAQAEFSSLMFLTQSPPRLTKRSRLDQWPLLLLRALAIILLAMAFARPFMRSLASLNTEPPARRIMVLVDTSASMRRGDLWNQAKEKIQTIISDLSPRDQIALTTFDSIVREIVTFDTENKSQPAAQRQRIQKAITEIELTHSGSNLGAALVAAADMLHNDTEQTDEEEFAPAQIALISDLQEGCDLSLLQQYQWPEEITVSVSRVATPELDNLSAVILPQKVDANNGDTPQLRVRFHNTSDSQTDEFMYFWDKTGETSDEVDHIIQVPAGESRVVRIDVPQQTTTSLMFVGDKQPFDNEVFVALPTKEQQTVLFVGSVASDKKASLFYYLQQTALGNPWREVDIMQIDPAELITDIQPHDTPLIVVGTTLASPATAVLKKYLAAGGHLLFVIQQSPDGYAKPEVTLRELSDSKRLSISEALVDDYAMLGQINFAHSIFLPFADPKYNDFTKIRFWNHRDIEFEESDGWQVVTSFDNTAPALLEKQFDRGRLWVLAAGWQPKESQLALSTKFLPLMASMVDSNLGATEVRSSYEIGDEGKLPVPAPLQLALPDGTINSYKEPVTLSELTQPGLYQIIEGAKQTPFAMNIPASESRTASIDVDQLEQYGVATDDIESQAEIAGRERQMQDIELEGRQRIWQWLIFAALVVLVAETWLGGFLSRHAMAKVP